MQKAPQSRSLWKATLAGPGAVLVLALMFAGCGGGSSGGGSSTAGAPFAGRVDGGGPQSPISGSTIIFYAMTSSGYGMAGSVLATATSNSAGGFTISSYTCPSATTETYVTATGGNAGAGTNSAIGLMALTGQCGSLTSSSVVVLNELTTVAAEWELAQFSDSTGANFGTSSTNATGLDNAINQTTSNLVTSVGTSVSSAGIPARLMPSAAQCSASSPPVNCDALERLDTLANILASCINTSGPTSTQCSTLFSNTNNSTTTLEAAHYIVTSPTTNVAAIYGISPPAGMTLFSPTLSSAPSSWMLALNFATTSDNFGNPYDLAVDSSGNVWVSNYNNNSVTELNSSGALVGNYTPSSALNGPYGLAVDGSGNVWVANPAGNTVTELNSSGALVGNYAPSGANFNYPYSVAVDSSGNVWVPNDSGNTVTELNSSGGLVGNYAPSGANFSSPARVAVDGSGNIWVTNQTGASVTELNSSGALVGNYAPSGANFSDPFGLAVDGSGNVWVANYGSNSVTELNSSGGLVGNYAPSGANFNIPYMVAVDGSGNVWVPNFTGNTVTELNSSGGLVGNYAPSGANFSDPGFLAVDGSGNVWVPNFSGNSVAELLGAASPVKTPLAPGGPVTP